MKNIKTGRNLIMSFVLLMAIISTTLVYSAFNTKLSIEGEAMLRSIQDIRVTGIELVESSSGAFETYSPKYNKTSTNLYVTLPANSYVIYNITITNKSNVEYVVSKMEEISHNSNVTYESSLKVDEDVIDVAPSSGVTEKTFTIKISNNSEIEQKETLLLQYTFEEATYTASQLSYSNAATSCTTIQCALDELAILAS